MSTNDLYFLHCPPESSVRVRKRAIRPASYEDGKRSTINLGVEDLPAAPRPESVSRFRTDDELKRPISRRDNRHFSSSSDKEEAYMFLFREYNRVEDKGLKREMNSCWEEKENKLRERRKSLIMAPNSVVPAGKTRGSGGASGQTHTACRALENLMPMKDISTSHESDFHNDYVKGNKEEIHPKSEQEVNMSLCRQSLVGDCTSLPKPPPRRKRDARKQAELNLSKSSLHNTSNAPGATSILNTTSIPSTPSTPSTPGTTSTISLPSTPGTPGRSQEIFSYPNTPDMLATPDTDRGLSSTPDTLGTHSSPDTPSRMSSQSLLVEDNAFMNVMKKCHTLDNRIMRTNRVCWESRGSTENLTHGRSMRRSISEYQDTGRSSNMARRTISDPDTKKIKNKKGTSIRDRIFRSNKNEEQSQSIPRITFNRWSKKGRSRTRKQSGEDQSDGEGNECTSCCLLCCCCCY